MLAALLVATAAMTAAPGVPEPLDWAGRFADALAGDAKDRERAQESVVLDIAMTGSLDEAVRRADRVEGWRRGVAYAELAKMLAKAGRVAEAKALLGKADTVRRATEGWQGPRIESHVAQAEALIGGMESPARAGDRLESEDALQYRGLPAVMRAGAHAARGEFAPAMAELEAASGDAAIEMSWPTTQVYLELARHPKLSGEQRLAALDAARASAAKIEERITQLDAMESVAEGYRRAGFEERARELLGEFHGMVVKMSDEAVLKAPYLAGEARTRAKMGERAAAVGILDDAARIGSQAYTLDRPAILANVAAGYHVAGESAKASSTLEAALSAAESLGNARPRALAFVEIGRALGRFDVPMTPPVRARFERALAGLKAPW